MIGNLLTVIVITPTYVWVYGFANTAQMMQPFLCAHMRTQAYLTFPHVVFLPVARAECKASRIIGPPCLP